MNKEVIISIEGQEIIPEMGEENKTELVTEGKYYKKGEKHYLSYKETEVTGFDATTTMLKIEDNRVALTRNGQVNTHMVFASGEKHTGYYDTPYGSFTVGVISDDVKVSFEENRGKIDIHYLLEIDNNTKAEHTLSLQVREA